MSKVNFFLTIITLGFCVVFKAQVPGRVLWVKADKGVNSSTGVPADNTQVSTWYDQETSDGTQNGTAATTHPGQSNETILPRLPYYKYSSVANGNFNHNPIINFSNLGSGNAVQFNTPTGLSQTVFTVFRAAGTGSNYNNMLLYGGDISDPSGGYTPDTRSDMYLGVANFGILGVGGGASGDYYTPGDLSLQTRISIGTLKRNRISDENLIHSLYANGSTDALNINADPTNLRTGEGKILSGLVRIGKHFSGPQTTNATDARLNGAFAELIVYDRVLSEANRAKVESYLAIKYGITLTGGADQLGSTVGNSGYNYVNSAGTTIRTSDATYKFDVFGIGRDDYFGLNQRISKSSNTNDILTVSTNSDFTSLNLATTRTAINGDREFMLFANNKGSADVVNEQTTELPLTILKRLDREWKVTYANTDGANIQNVSLRFDLSGFTFSDVTNNNLRLLIDTDGNGDFTDGTVLKVSANTFVSGSYAVFNNINLTNGAIFTLGVLSCAAGDVPPIVNSISFFCPSTSANLATAHTGTIPTGASLVWYNNDTHNGAALTASEITNAPVGTYYAFYYDSSLDCYSPVSNAVTVTNSTVSDIDGDNVPDACDLDNDNDGILDTVECSSIYYLVRPVTSSSVTANKPITSGTAQKIADGEGASGTGVGPYPHWYTIVSNLPIAFNMNMQSPSTIDHIKLYDPWGNSEWIGNFTVELYNTSNTLLGTENLITPDKYTGTPIFSFTKEYTNVTSIRFTIVSSQGYSTTTPPRASVKEIVFLDLQPLTCDTDNDGVPNHLDLDSDNDGCTDALEGDENVTTSQLVNAGGTVTVGTGSTASNLNLCANGTCVDANGVPTVVNSGGAADIGANQGQGIGSSQNASVNSCFCYKSPATIGTTLDTNHGITALGRAGADNGNWPMVRKGAWTILEAKTKGFVVNRLTDAQISAIPAAQLVEGMMVYNITQDCLQINIDGTATGWKCLNNQTCPD